MSFCGRWCALAFTVAALARCWVPLRHPKVEKAVSQHTAAKCNLRALPWCFRGTGMAVRFRGSRRLRARAGDQSSRR